MTVRFFNEMRRRYYTTPSSYLDLLKLYIATLNKKMKETLLLKGKIANGLNVGIFPTILKIPFYYKYHIMKYTKFSEIARNKRNCSCDERTIDYFGSSVKN